MYKAIILFFLLQLTLLARYLVFDAFEPLTYVATFLVPIFGFLVRFISKKLTCKEEKYQPSGISYWSFYHIQKSILNSKPLFKGNERRGYIKRYFEKKWQHVVADIFGFNSYLSLEIKIDENSFVIRWNPIKRLSQQEYWKIYKNGEEIGEARTLINVKNTVKLTEVMEFTFEDKTLTTSATTVTSAISLCNQSKEVGTMKRNHLISNVDVLDVQDDCLEYLIALITHEFYFKNG